MDVLVCQNCGGTGEILVSEPDYYGGHTQCYRSCSGCGGSGTVADTRGDEGCNSKPRRRRRPVCKNGKTFVEIAVEQAIAKFEKWQKSEREKND